MVSIIVGRCTAAGAGFRTSMLGITVLAPCTGGIAVITILRCGVPASAAGGRSAVLAGRRIAPRSITHAVRSVVVVRCSAIPAVIFTPMLRCRILFPRAIAVVVSAGIDRLRFCLTAGTRIASVTVAGAGGCLLTLQHPCMTAAIRAGARPISTGSVALGSVCS